MITSSNNTNKRHVHKILLKLIHLGAAIFETTSYFSTIYTKLDPSPNFITNPFPWIWTIGTSLYLYK